MNNDRRVQELLDHAWLGLGDTSRIQTTNPFFDRSQFDIENPHLHLLGMMRKPEYFGFTCKHVLNRTLAPFQLAILHELWHRPSPMLIGTRGLGKCVTGDTLVMSGRGLVRLDSLVGKEAPGQRVPLNVPVLGEAGAAPAEYGWNNGHGPTVRVETRKGFVLEGTPDHPVRVVRQGSIHWVNLADTTTEDWVVLSCRTEWPAGPAADEDFAWLAGLFAPDACRPERGLFVLEEVYEDTRVRVAQTIGKPMVRQRDKSWQVASPLDWKRLEEPWPLRCREEAVAWVAGLFEGHFEPRGRFRLGTSELARRVQVVLSHLGIVSSRRASDLQLTGAEVRKLLGLLPLSRRHGEVRPVEGEHPDVPAEVYARHLLAIEDSLEGDEAAWVRSLLGREALAQRSRLLELASTRGLGELDEMLRRPIAFDQLVRREESSGVTYDLYVPPLPWQDQGHSFVSNGFVSHNSFLLGTYAVLRALLEQGSRVVIVGAGFRQSKSVFEYCERIWQEAPILRDIVGTGTRQLMNGPRKDADLWTLRMGESVIAALPMGTGENIRGQRACVGPETLVETNRGLLRIGEAGERLGAIELFTGDGAKREKPSHFVQTDPIDAWEVRTTRGYHFTCSAIHQVLTVSGWKLGRLLRPGRDRLLLENHYQWPTEPVVADGHVVGPEAAWLLGYAASWSRSGRPGRLFFQMLPPGRVDELEERIRAFRVNVLVARREVRLNAEMTRVNVLVQGKKFRRFLGELGLGYQSCSRQRIPWTILQSSREVMLAYLRGLFTDRLRVHERGKLRVQLTFRSQAMLDEVRVVLWKLGVAVYEEKKLRKTFALWVHNGSARRLLRLLDIPCSPGPEDVPERMSLVVTSVRPLPGKHVLYDFTVPVAHSFMGNGFCQHNTHVIADEFGSISVDIFEQVVAGFSAVSASPVERMQLVARLKLMKSLGVPLTDDVSKLLGANQTIISGTANYTFNHFYRYWSRYKAIIESQGDERKLREVFGGQVPDDFDWRDYAIIRVPYDLIPAGYMDEKTLAKNKATLHRSKWFIEYAALFPADSNGFYKRSVVESCVVGKPEAPILAGSCGEVRFSAALRGTRGRRYVMGIDPASEIDNFAIVVVEMWPDHRRIVHCWTTRKDSFKARLVKGLTDEHDFYGYVARKIRMLKRLFHPMERIAIDSQGGGIAVMEALGDPTRLATLGPEWANESPIYPVVVDGEEHPTDHMVGEHLIVPVQFSSAEYVGAANHGMRKDFEDKVLLFPEFDAVSLGLAIEEDKLTGRTMQGDDGPVYLHDTLEACMMEIEELKDELSSIVHTQTGTSKRDRWDTPEEKLPGGKKGRQRKDRYSALLMANAEARLIMNAPPEPVYETRGGFAHQLAAQKDRDRTGPGWIAPAWYLDRSTGSKAYGVVPRKS